MIFAGAQFAATVDEVHHGSKLGEVSRFFHRSVAAAHYNQSLVAKSRQGAVADRAGRHAAVLVLVL
jgi:hypothetical protein